MRHYRTLLASLTVAASVAVAACSGGGTAATTTALITTTAAATTTTVAPTTTLSKQDQLVAAKAAWVTKRSSFANGAATDVGYAIDQPVAASISNTDGLMTFWQFANGEWQGADSVRFIHWSDVAPLLGSVDSLSMLDADNDGADEVVVNFTVNHGATTVYQRQASGWGIVYDGTGVAPQGNRLEGTENLCMPSCADGGSVDFYLKSSDGRLVPQYVDRAGKPVTLFQTSKCDKFVSDQAGTLRRCMYGPNVQSLQQMLQTVGMLYHTGGSGADGYFGADTETSVRIFQLLNYMPVTGLADVGFLTALDDYIAGQ